MGNLLNWFIFAGGIAGIIGTWQGWPLFFDENRMANTIDRYGRDRVRNMVLGTYAVFSVLGAFLLFF